jgi:hypothetical protein
MSLGGIAPSGIAPFHFISINILFRAGVSEFKKTVRNC